MSDTRIINVTGDINESNAMNIILKLLYLNSESKSEPITLYINSNGGSISYGLAIYDAINNIEAPVYTKCFGCAASMGAFLLSCGRKGHRSAYKHSKVLIHQPLLRNNDNSVNTESETRKIAVSIDKNRKILEEILANNTGHTIEELHKDCERDNWMSSEEALNYGLIDEII